jgi:hypothetical protein
MQACLTSLFAASESAPSSAQLTAGAEAAQHTETSTIDAAPPSAAASAARKPRKKKRTLPHFVRAREDETSATVVLDIPNIEGLFTYYILYNNVF